jgi:hypothetical protein
VNALNAVLDLNNKMIYEHKPYTKRELARWEAAKAFIDRLNAKLDKDPRLVLFWRDDRLTKRVEEFHHESLSGGVIDKWLAFKSSDGRCTQGVFSLNESCDTPIREILKELRDDFKIYKEVKF